MTMEMIDIVRKLIGPIEPVGETNADDARFENLKEMILLVDKLLYDINGVSISKDRPEYSMGRAGKLAYEFMREIKDET